LKLFYDNEEDRHLKQAKGSFPKPNQPTKK